MKELDVKKCEFDNIESCYHLTRRIFENEISEKGLNPSIGIRSKDGLGKEKTSKIFFAKSLEGTLIFLNRDFNIFRSAAKHNNFAMIKSGLKDDSLELYEKIFTDMVHDDMSEEELDEVALALGKLYLERGIYYKLDLKHCTREEFRNMDDQDKDEIDYFSNDINEERPSEQPMISNMHTRSGRGVKPSQMTLMTSDGKKSALDIAISMSEFYKALNPDKSLPVLEFDNGKKDRPLLEMLVTRIKEKSTQQSEKRGLEDCLGDETLRASVEQEATRVVNETVQGKSINAKEQDE